MHIDFDYNISRDWLVQHKGIYLARQFFWHGKKSWSYVSWTQEWRSELLDESVFFDSGGIGMLRV